MFYDRPDCIKLADQVFVFKNYINGDLKEHITKDLMEKDENSFKYEESQINWYVNKVSPMPDRILELWEHLSELIYPEYVIHPMTRFLKIKPGDGGMFVHSDSPGKGCKMELTQWDVWDTCCIIDYGFVGYLGDFTGGAIFYPHINPDGTIKGEGENLEGPCLEYTPEPGDVVIHSAFHPYEHGVREVESGVRYAFSNFSLRADENPGSFYNYKSEEYKKFFEGKEINEQTLTDWVTPFYESETVTRLKKQMEEKESVNA